jgi:hypothetical protein
MFAQPRIVRWFALNETYSGVTVGVSKITLSADLTRHNAFERVCDFALATISPRIRARDPKCPSARASAAPRSPISGIFTL